MTLNVSFSFSRKLRDEIDSSFNLQAALLIFLSIMCTGINCYMLWRIWTIIGHTQDQIVTLLLILVLVAEVALLCYTMWLGAMDCNIANATWLAAYLTYCLYRYSMRSVEPECSIVNFTIGNMIYIFVNSMFHADLRDGWQWRCSHYSVLPQILHHCLWYRADLHAADGIQLQR